MLRVEAISNTLSKDPVDFKACIVWMRDCVSLTRSIVKSVDAYLVPVLEKHMKRKEKAKKVSRSIGVIVALVVLIGCIDGSQAPADAGTDHKYP